MKFTVFTPTYNRAYILHKLYESLLKQTKKDFEWLIVDDGSTDNTESLVQKWIKESTLNIRYYKQENQGKHIAINKALELTKGEYLITVDSDDYIEDNCIEVCHTLAKKVDNKNNFAGFTFIHFSDKIPYDKEKYGKKEWTKEQDYQWEFHGEMSWVFKISIAKKYPFPIYKEEKFCQESVFFIPILRDYNILFTDNVLVHGDYLEDGLSQNTYRRMLKNPRYSILSFKRKLSIAKNNDDKLYLAKCYWDIATKTGGGIIKNIFNFPIYWTIKVFIHKLLKKYNF